LVGSCTSAAGEAAAGDDVVDEAEKLVLNLSSEGGHMGGTIGGFETRELDRDNIHACIPHTRVCQEQSPQGIQNRAFLLFRLERFTTTTVDGRRRRSTKEFLVGR
jgi:hypothetical protein